MERILAVLIVAGNAYAGAGWPSYLGENGAFSETSGVKLGDDMSKVKLAWSYEDKTLGFGKAVSSAGRGYAEGTALAYGGEASAIVAGGLVIHFYTTPCGETTWAGADAVAEEFKKFHKVGADESVVALDALTGKMKWKQTFADKGLNTVPGKRGGFAVTPCAAGGKVFAMGTMARLYCLELATGKVVWESAVAGPLKALEAFKATGLKDRKVGDRPGGRPYGILTVVDDVLLAPEWGGGGLVGFDTATGKELWRVPGALSGFNCPVAVGKQHIACVNGNGELRYIEAKTGKVLWTHPLGSQHLTQPVFAGELLIAFESHPKFTGDMVGKSKSPNALGNLAAYRLTEKGAEKVWSLAPEYLQHLFLDGGASRKIVARGGLVYASMRKCNGTDPKQDKERFVIVSEKDGKVLKEAGVAGWNLYLWGDRLITVTDIQHRPRAANPEIWQMYHADPVEFRPLGQPWHVNGNPPVHTATGGYELPVLEPFADGLFFCRVWGGIRAYDLRAGR
jgi:outer membrane protein assembly factor BamB